ELEVSDPELGIDDRGLTPKLKRRRVISGVEGEHRRQRVVHGVERFEFASALDGTKRFIMPLKMGEDDAQHSMRQRIIAVEFDCATESSFRDRPIPIQEIV